MRIAARALSICARVTLVCQRANIDQRFATTMKDNKMTTQIIRLTTIVLLMMVTTLPAVAVDRQVMLSIPDAIERSGLNELLKEKSMSVYWADQVPPSPIEKEFEPDTYTRSANAVLKSDVRACSNAFETLFEQLVKDAGEMGANAIIGIRSYHEALPDVSSETEYRCEAGKFRGLVGLRVRFVKLAK